jgi:hypothetical protein
MTAIVRKKELREKVDVNFDGRIGFLEYLLYQYASLTPLPWNIVQHEIAPCSTNSTALSKVQGCGEPCGLCDPLHAGTVYLSACLLSAVCCLLTHTHTHTLTHTQAPDEHPDVRKARLALEEVLVPYLSSLLLSPLPIPLLLHLLSSPSLYPSLPL